jgi:hypothetical protein
MMVKYAVSIDERSLTLAITEIGVQSEVRIGCESHLVGNGRPVFVWTAGQGRAGGDAPDAWGLVSHPTTQCFDTIGEACSSLEEGKRRLIERIRERTRHAGREIKEHNRSIRAKRAEVEELWRALKALSILSFEEIEAKSET